MRCFFCGYLIQTLLYLRKLDTFNFSDPEAKIILILCITSFLVGLQKKTERFLEVLTVYSETIYC